MACTPLTVGIAADCTNNLGGIKKVYITDFTNMTEALEVSGEITTITLASGTQYYEFAFNKNTSTFGETATISVENGSLFYAQTVTLKIRRREVSKRNALKLLMQKDLSVIVQDLNDEYWLIGKTLGAVVSELPSESGTAKGDFNGYTITLLAEEPEAAQTIDSSIISALI